MYIIQRFCSSILFIQFYLPVVLHGGHLNIAHSCFQEGGVGILVDINSMLEVECMFSIYYELYIQSLNSLYMLGFYHFAIVQLFV